MDTTDWTVEDHIEWMRHHAETLRIMERLRLNQVVTTMVYYDLPWMRDFAVSDHLDAFAVQRALMEHGPNPVLMRKAEEREEAKNCDQCGGTESRHYNSCSWWKQNNMRVDVFVDVRSIDCE